MPGSWALSRKCGAISRTTIPSATMATMPSNRANSIGIWSAVLPAKQVAAPGAAASASARNFSGANNQAPGRTAITRPAQPTTRLLSRAAKLVVQIFHFVLEVIDLLLATPEPGDPLRVRLPEFSEELRPERPWVLYQFEDPALQQLSAGQRMLLRSGPDNMHRVKQVLRALRPQITSTATTE